MSLIVRDYRCSCGLSEESIEARDAPAELPCACGGMLQRVMSAPAVHMPIAWVTRGKSDPRPPGAFDTRPIADGMPLHQWRKMRSQQRIRRRYEQIKANT